MEPRLIQLAEFLCSQSPPENGVELFQRVLRVGGLAGRLACSFLAIKGTGELEG